MMGALQEQKPNTTVSYNPNEAHIVYASDDGFAEILGVSMVSLYENSKDMEFIAVYVLDSGIIICLVLSGISYILDVLDVPRLPWNFGTAMMAVLFIEIGFQINKMDILNKLKYQGCGVQIFVCIIILFSATIGIILNPVEIVEFSANNYGSFILMIIESYSCILLSV